MPEISGRPIVRTWKQLLRSSWDLRVRVLLQLCAMGLGLKGCVTITGKYAHSEKYKGNANDNILSYLHANTLRL